MKSKMVLALLACAVLAACGDDNPSNPSHVDLGGVWHIAFSDMSNSGISCSGNPTDMSLSMSGVTFSGTHGPITLSCTGAAGTFQSTLGGTIVNGTVGVTAVNFDLDTPDFHQTGNTSGCLPGECEVPFPYDAIYMSGTAVWTVNLGGGQSATLNGTWQAFKQSPELRTSAPNRSDRDRLKNGA